MMTSQLFLGNKIGTRKKHIAGLNIILFEREGWEEGIF